MTTILVGVMLMALVALAAFAVDIGELLWSREVQQNAADAAALAGARELPSNPDAAIAVATNYAASNGFASTPGEIAVSASVSTIFNANDSLVVTITRTIPPGLRAAVGGGDIDVPARAVAIVAPARPPCHLLPFGIERDALLYSDYTQGITTTRPYSTTYGQKVILQVATQNNVSPGNFLLLDLDRKGGGANEARAAVAAGGGCSANNQVDTLPGGKGGPIGQGVRDAIKDSVRDPANWNGSTTPPDNVAWWQSAIAQNGGRPFGLPNPPRVYQSSSPTPHPWELSQNRNDYACSDVASGVVHFPPVRVPTKNPLGPAPCKRVGIVPILPTGTFVQQSGSKTVTIVDYAAFYLIGTESHAGTDWVVGAFLSQAEVQGVPNPGPGHTLNGPLAFALWE